MPDFKIEVLTHERKHWYNVTIEEDTEDEALVVFQQRYGIQGLQQTHYQEGHYFWMTNEEGKKVRCWVFIEEVKHTLAGRGRIELACEMFIILFMALLPVLITAGFTGQLPWFAFPVWTAYVAVLSVIYSAFLWKIR